MSPFAPMSVLDAQGRPLDVVEIRDLRIDCIVGVYRAERNTPQPLVLDAALYLDTRLAASGGHLRDTIDYARLSGELRFVLESASFRLLETAADALCRYVLAPPTDDGCRAHVHAVALRLSKPDALPGGTMASLQVFRRAEEYTFGREEKDFGKVDVIYEDEAVGVYRLRIKPGGTIETHEHRLMDESELVLGSGLLLQGRPVLAGTGYDWPRHFPHRYDNPADIEQSILCINRPRFIPEDEVLVPPPETGLGEVSARSYYPVGASTHEERP